MSVIREVMMHPMPKTAKGVTLVELMIVVALIAVIAAIASPGISRGIERANSRSAAREVAAQLRLARSQAMSRGAPFWVQVTAADGADRGSVGIFRHPTADVRSCRELGAATPVEVSRFSLNTISGRSALRRVIPTVTVNTGMTYCFSPDGRVLAANGTNLPTTGDGRCVGEGGFLAIWDSSQSAAAAQINCASTAADRSAQHDARDVINLFRISIPFNGAISVDQ